MKLDVVIKVQGEELEICITKIENNAVVGASPDLTYFWDQLDRLDPAQKSLALIGTKGNRVRPANNYSRASLLRSLPL